MLWHWVIEQLALRAIQLSLLSQSLGRWRLMTGLIILVQDLKRSPEAFWAHVLFDLSGSYCMWWHANGVLISPSSARAEKKRLHGGGHLPCVTAPVTGPSGICWEGLNGRIWDLLPNILWHFNCSRQLEKTLEHHEPFKPRAIRNTSSQASPECIALVIIQLTMCSGMQLNKLTFLQ